MQKWALCLEQTLGHRAHSQNLESLVDSSAPIDVHRIHYPETARVPVPWAVRGSWRARTALRSSGQQYRVVFYHTQSVSLFAPQTSAAERYVVSVDATPVQVDGMGQWYKHRKGLAPVESVKSAWYRRVFAGAAAVVSWSEWAAESLTRDYGVAASKVLVAHPGAPPEFFEMPRPQRCGKPRILFVGGDFERKGGPALLRAFAAIADRAELVIVSDAEIPSIPGVIQERGVRPGSERLYAAYANSDIFCFPTLGDCTPLVLGEAMAAGLPVVTTTVGSNAETLGGGEGGILVEPGSITELTTALEALVDDVALRERFGSAARSIARDKLDAARNGSRVLSLLRTVAS